MKTFKGSEAENYIKDAGYGKVSKKFLENLFIVEDFVDGFGDEVPVSSHYNFLVNSDFGDAFLEDIYPCADDVEFGLGEMAAFGISGVTIEVDEAGNVTIAE